MTTQTYPSKKWVFAQTRKQIKCMTLALRFIEEGERGVRLLERLQQYGYSNADCVKVLDALFILIPTEY